MASGRRAVATLALSLVWLSACDGDIGEGPTDGGGASGGEAGASTTTTTTSTSGDGGSGAGYVPDPIPDIDPEPPPLCDAPSTPFQFLDDACGAKRFPSHADRDLACPSVAAPSRSHHPATTPVVVEDALGDVVPPELDVTVIDIRRVDGVPHYRYLSNGSHAVTFQPWSTTKFIAAANAGARLRLASNDAVGLTGSAGGYALGDLVTAACDYSYDPFSSNSIGRYFHDIGTRARADDLIGSLWLDRPPVESFGGNYGEASPNIGYTIVDGSESISLTPDQSGGYVNHLSTFTLAEALKRLVLQREEPSQRMPGLTWPDVRTLLYGADATPFGGMSADRAVYLQSGHDFDYLEARSHGRWRIFSKLGNGSGGEFLNVGYACLPVLDPAGEPVADWGRELVIAAHLPIGGQSWAERDRMLARAVRAILIRAVAGSL